MNIKNVIDPNEINLDDENNEKNEKNEIYNPKINIFDTYLTKSIKLKDIYHLIKWIYLNGETTIPRWCFIDNKLKIKNINVIILPNDYYLNYLPIEYSNFNNCFININTNESDWINSLFYKNIEKKIEYVEKECDIEDLLLSEDELLSNGFVIPYKNENISKKRKYDVFNSKIYNIQPVISPLSSKNPSNCINILLIVLGIYGTSYYNISTFYCDDKKCNCIEDYIIFENKGDTEYNINNYLEKYIV